MNYGKAANSIAREIGIVDRIASEHPEMSEKRVKWAAKDEAQALINKYFSRIPGAFKFIQRTYYEAAHTKYVETFLGRRRWLHEIMDWEDKERHLARAAAQHRDLCWCDKCKTSRDGERKSVNTIIQGTAADVMQCAMIRSHFDPRLKELSTEMLLQVHDEAMWEVPADCVDDALPIIQENLENPGINLRVPFKAAPGCGDDWVEAKV